MADGMLGDRHWLKAVEESKAGERKDKEQRKQHTRAPCVIGCHKFNDGLRTHFDDMETQVKFFYPFLQYFSASSSHGPSPPYYLSHIIMDTHKLCIRLRYIVQGLIHQDKKAIGNKFK